MSDNFNLQTLTIANLQNKMHFYINTYIDIVLYTQYIIIYVFYLRGIKCTLRWIINRVHAYDGKSTRYIRAQTHYDNNHPLVSSIFDEK